MSKIPDLKAQVMSQAKSHSLGRYIWECGIGPQLGYSFSKIHSLAYSFIGFQTAFISTNWNSVYWDTACLVVNSGSLENEGSLKAKSADYAKMAKAIGDIRTRGTAVSLININESDYGFKPDATQNQILFGLNAISNISPEVVEKIISGRPYASFKDFLIRCPLTKTAMLNLIKGGAFDGLDKNFKTRVRIMVYYISLISEPKKRLTLQNFSGLVQRGLLPKELELQLRFFNFNAYLKKNKVGKYYTFDDACISFFDRFLSEEVEFLDIINGVTCIKQEIWDKIYKKLMNPAREYLKENQAEMLKTYNKALFHEQWDKYAAGGISKWEMEALCFYYHEHELARVDKNRYGIVNFNSLSEEPAIDYTFKRGGRDIPIYKLSKIIGTVIAKIDTKSIVVLLTTEGVVNVKFAREYYAMFKKQISDIDPTTGSKKVVEKGWFGRGNMLMITGFRRDDTFVAKTYTATQSHQLYKITDVLNGDIKLTHERWTSDTSQEEDYEY